MSTGHAGQAGRGGLRRGLTTSLLVTLAIVVAAALMAVLSTQAIMASSDCAEHPVLANVAVSNDIAPAVQKVAQYFNRLHREIGGHCAEVQVTEELPATAAAQIDGKEPQHGMPPIDAWIPDSTLWVNQARAMPQGAQVVQTTGVHVAMSPLMIVMPQSVAAGLGPVAKSIGWNFLLPQTAGGPPAADGVKVELPDPKLSAAGLATVIEVNRLLGTGQAAGENFTRFAFGADETEQYDNPAALSSLIALSNPPLNERTVTVASEQSVIQFDQTHPQPLAARYPSDGSPELDYPYVLTTTNAARLRAAQEFGKILSQDYTASVVRYAGFRSADNIGARTPGSYGLDSQPLSVLPLGGPNTATVTLQAWDRVRIGIRILVIIDTSSSMGTRSSPAGPTLMQELVAAANEGLLLFPQSTVMGLWEFNNNLDGTKPYKWLVPVGPLNAELGLISRREQLQQLNQTFAPRPGAKTKLNTAVLAAYKYMIRTYDPRYSNTVVVMTAGQDDAPGDISNESLLRQVRALNKPSHHVGLLFDVFGHSPIYPAILRLVRVTGGAAFNITDPTEINKVFFVSVGRVLSR
ncbi:MAG TPA: substrate-binding and VWA domain-containing protein [Streptosporangiaceae bacterium]|nr:substrate-binding and VWA domain-containing protein [Streptosporangiaceae bacterium]